MTDKILNLFGRHRKPAPQPTADERRMELMQHRVRQLGDRVRDLDRWAVSYRIRTGRAA